MPAHELVGDGLDRVGDAEMTRFGLELSQKDGFEHEVAELLGEGGVVVPIDRVEHLVGFFEDERFQRVDRLLAIPRTTAGAAERGHDVDETAERRRGARRVGHLIS